MTQDVGNVAELLQKRGFLKRDRNRLWAIADKIVKGGYTLTESHLDQIQAHYGSLGREVESETLAALANGEWVALVHDLAHEAEGTDRKNSTTKASGLQFVSAENPYGWPDDGPNGKALLDRHRERTDNNVPEKWNPYRQCYNLSVTEKRDQVAPDFRRRGCSRVEVVGGIGVPAGWRPGLPVVKYGEVRVPKTFWDPDEVANAVADETRRKAQ